MTMQLEQKGSFRSFDRVTDAALMRVGERAMDQYLRRVTDRLAAKHDRAPGTTTRGSLARVTGEGMDRLQDYDVRENGGDVEGVLHLTDYMATHEFGGLIRPKGKTYLTVPLPAALKSDGTPKKLSARAWRHSRVIRSRRGNLLIVMQQGRRAVPLYVLKEKVRIPARLGLRKEMNHTRPTLWADVQRGIRQLLKSD